MHEEHISWNQIPEVFEDALHEGAYEEALQHYLTLRSKYKRIYDSAESVECYRVLTKLYEELQESQPTPVAQKPIYALIHKSWTKARAISVVVIFLVLLLSGIIALIW